MLIENKNFCPPFSAISPKLKVQKFIDSVHGQKICSKESKINRRITLGNSE